MPVTESGKQCIAKADAIIYIVISGGGSGGRGSLRNANVLGICIRALTPAIVSKRVGFYLNALSVV